MIRGGKVKSACIVLDALYDAAAREAELILS